MTKTRPTSVLVVMNDEIHAAKYVTKTHATNVSTFRTPTHGPLGLVMKLKSSTSKQPSHSSLTMLERIQGLVPIISAMQV